mmetsp:Transcript_52841/g.141133  ORF Transcript_52841/g.141133 Transcript_52841/m.141133 type:complete len:221 (-) Transcript_52841:84-746(-)
MRRSFSSLVWVRVTSSRKPSSSRKRVALAWCSSALLLSSVLYRPIKISMSPSNSSADSTTASRNPLYCTVLAIFRCSTSLAFSFSLNSASRTLISISRRRRSACSSRTFLSHLSIFESSSLNDFSFSSTCFLNSSRFMLKCSSFNLHLARRLSTLARVKSSFRFASSFSLAFFNICVACFSSCKAFRIARNFEILSSLGVFHSSRTSLRQCFSTKFRVNL